MKKIIETQVGNAEPSSTVVTLEAITLDESTRLIELETIINAGQQTFIEIGNALAEIRDTRLYRSDFASFEAYCKKKWDFTKQHAYRLIKAAPIAASNLQVTSLNQARELAKVPPANRATVINVATTKAKAAGRELAAKDITEAAQPSSDAIAAAPDQPATALPTEQGEGIHCPRAKTERELQNWYYRATRRKRGEFVKFLFTFGAVETEDKAELKVCMNRWFENYVTEVKPKSEDDSRN